MGAEREKGTSFRRLSGNQMYGWMGGLRAEEEDRDDQAARLVFYFILFAKKTRIWDDIEIGGSAEEDIYLSRYPNPKMNYLCIVCSMYAE